MPLNYTYSDVAKMIDHSLLNPSLTWNELEDGIALALAYDVASVCILPYAVKFCSERLCGSNVRASTTIGLRQSAARHPVGAVADQRPTHKRLRRRIDRVDQILSYRLQRRGVGGLGALIGRSTRAERLHKPVMNRRGLRTQRLKTLTVSAKQSRNGC